MNQSLSVQFYHSLQKFGIQPGLERMRILCDRLGNPQNSFKTIHVAGTNGKGSTCTEIASILNSAGYKVGLYTSPYVIDFRERIQYCGKMISSAELENVTEIIKEKIEELSKDGIVITEFEAVTAAAFLFYKNSGCEIAVIETGLGGRFDATNVIENKICSIITSISMDHVKILGNTIGEIAFEKCGIIKNNTPVVTSVNQLNDAMQIIKRVAENNNSELYLIDTENWIIKTSSINGTDVEINGIEFHIPFCGEHQLENTSLVFSVIDILRKNSYNVSIDSVKDGLINAFIPARTEIIKKEPLIILDGSHNDGSTYALAKIINKYLNGKKIIGVIGMMADKDIENVMDNLIPYFSKVITVTPSNPRSKKSIELKRLLDKYNIECSSEEDPINGVKKAYEEISDYEAMIVCGSLYLASDVRSYLLEL